MMTEEEAKAWLSARHVPRETMERLARFVHFLIEENEQQNLVSRATIPHIWARHIVDSAQLLDQAESAESPWLDLGTGAGFPGLVIALLHGGPVTLVEERRLRVSFLSRAAEMMELGDRITIRCSKAERLEPQPFGMISARAFAPLDKLLTIGHSFSTAKTRWILPKGRNARSELEAAQASWQGDFRLVPSLTDADASIIVADGVVPKRKGAGRDTR